MGRAALQPAYRGRLGAPQPRHPRRRAAQLAAAGARTDPALRAERLRLALADASELTPGATAYEGRGRGGRAVTQTPRRPGG